MTTTEAWAVKGPDDQYVTATICVGGNAESYTRAMAMRWKAMTGGDYKHVRVRITEVPNE